MVTLSLFASSTKVAEEDHAIAGEVVEMLVVAGVTDVAAAALAGVDVVASLTLEIAIVLLLLVSTLPVEEVVEEADGHQMILYEASVAAGFQHMNKVSQAKTFHIPKHDTLPPLTRHRYTVDTVLGFGNSQFLNAATSLSLSSKNASSRGQSYTSQLAVEPSEEETETPTFHPCAREMSQVTRIPPYEAP